MKAALQEKVNKHRKPMFVSSLPDKLGNWDKTDNYKKAINLSPYWQKRLERWAERSGYRVIYYTKD